jgi:phage recombination protein Bet
MVETVWPGIAEIRTTASRTGQYAGIDAVEFGPVVERSFSGQTGGNNSETITKKVRYPEWASVVVYRLVAGVRCAYHAKVYWEETYATMGKSDVPNEMWAKRPRGQLDKCVEAAALRKAFPEELGNIYAAEEMEGRDIGDGSSIDSVAAKQPPKPPAPPAPPAAEHVEADADGVVIEHDAAAENATADEEVVDDNAYFEQFEEAVAVASDLASLEEVWTEFDPMARFDGKPNAETNQGIAKAIRKRAEKRIGGAA